MEEGHGIELFSPLFIPGVEVLKVSTAWILGKGYFSWVKR